MAKPRATRDDGLQRIDNLQRFLVNGTKQTLRARGDVTAEEIAREVAAVEKLAAAICDQLRAEYRARTPQP
jgi:hypothetical protein